MKILVCGSRNWRDEEKIRLVLFHWLCEVQSDGQDEVLHIVHGAQVSRDEAAKEMWGADYFAGQFAKENEGAENHPHPAQWKKYGRSAGPIRNAEMLKAHTDISMCLAFTDDPPGKKGSGTWDMVSKALAKGIPVRVYSHKKGEAP